MDKKARVYDLESGMVLHEFSDCNYSMGTTIYGNNQIFNANFRTKNIEVKDIDSVENVSLIQNENLNNMTYNCEVCSNSKDTYYIDNTGLYIINNLQEMKKIIDTVNGKSIANSAFSNMVASDKNEFYVFSHTKDTSEEKTDKSPLVLRKYTVSE